MLQGEQNGYLLIVEDTRTQSMHLESILGQLGFQVKTAANGKEALDILKTKKPVIVVSDILMPEMDGFELCRWIKSDSQMKNIPVVLLTQLSEPKEIIRGLECGADDFIVKPYSEELLIGRIKAVIALKLKNQAQTRQVNILVVEDSPTQAEQLKFLLEEHGYGVTVAGNGHEALEQARNRKPGMIISDVLMPVMDGFELAQEIKRDEKLSDIPIIIVTSMMDRKDQSKRASVVADGFFTKPYDEKYLISKVEALLASTAEEEKEKETIEISFEGENYRISSGKKQILRFLLSIYENSVHQNRDLVLMQKELQTINEQLEDRVIERTRKLKESEAKFRTLLETSSDAIVVISSSNTIFFSNRAAEELFGETYGELNGKDFDFEAKPGETRDIEISKKDGSKAIAEMRVAQTTWGNEKARLAALRDITGRKAMEGALRDSGANFRSLADNASDGILIMMPDGRNTYANRRAADISRYTVEELHDRGLMSLFESYSGQSCFEKLARAIGGSDVNCETELKTKDGISVPVEIKASGTNWHGHPAAIVIFRDITERKKKEEEFIMASKLESLSTLAGGIAHDFNNLLTGIVGNVSLAMLLIDPKEKIYRLMGDLERASLRAMDLTQQLLTFAKGGSPIKKAVSIGEIIRESAVFALRGTRVRCEFEIDEDLWPVEVDEGQITQVVHNLVLNSEQAMPEGGVVKIKAANVLSGNGKGMPEQNGRYIELSFTDTGTGIPEKLLGKIFDPYFTTKKKGSGLGLATVYSIIKKHDGHISVFSREGEGTAFHIYLPAANVEAEPVKDRDNEPVYGNGTILVMDDEEIVRQVAGEILSVLGYKVEFANDGKEAIELYREALENGRRYSAVLMDLTIPGGLGGKEAITELRKLDPSVRAVVSSGYSEDCIMSDYAKYGFSAVIAKPYRVAELSKVIDMVITGKEN